MFSAIQSLDTTILNEITKHWHTPLTDALMPFITYLGSNGFVWILISAVLLLQKKHRTTGGLVLAALLLTSVLGDGILKPLIHRPRPFVQDPSLQLLIAGPSTWSFPSGHTATSFAAAAVLSKAFRKNAVYFILLAALIAFSRLYLDVHYPSDIIGGIALGLCCAWLVSKYGNKLALALKRML